MSFVLQNRLSSVFLLRYEQNNVFLHFSKGINLTDHTSVTVYFGDLVSTHYRKDIYQNWLSILGMHYKSDFLLKCYRPKNKIKLITFSASFGGILGLLLGFSFVAGFELIYFFTIRVFFDRLANKKHKSTHRNVVILK